MIRIEKSRFNNIKTFFSYIEAEARAKYELTSEKIQNIKERVQKSVDKLFEFLASCKALEILDLAPWTKITLDDTPPEAKTLQDEGLEGMEPNDEELENLKFDEDLGAEVVVLD